MLIGAVMFFRSMPTGGNGHLLQPCEKRNLCAAHPEKCHASQIILRLLNEQSHLESFATRIWDTVAHFLLVLHQDC